ncbi:MAG: hypothetical protein AB8F95_03435 [Bacteroidia bacterium]
MQWYVKLFAPVIIALCLMGVLAILLTARAGNDEIFKLLAFVALSVSSWAFIQPLYFPRRPEKDRQRAMLTLFIIAFHLFPCFLILNSNNRFREEYLAWPISLIFLTTLFYLLRHRKPIYSLAPGWEHFKQLCAKFSMIGWAIFILFVLEDEFVHALGSTSPMHWENETIGIIMMIPWIIAQICACLFYYIEAIIHHVRNSPKNWQKRIDRIGD